MSIAERLRAQLLPPPGRERLKQAAERTASRANAVFGQQKLPVRAAVAANGDGYRIKLHQLGQINRPFGATKPWDLVKTIADEEIRKAAADISKTMIHG